MSKSYNEIMETIHMSEESHERILANVKKQCAGEKKIKIIFVPKVARNLMTAAAVVVCIIAVPVIYHLQNTSVNQEDNVTLGTDTSVQVENGIVECTSAEELSEKVGFPVYDLKKETLPFKTDAVEYYSYWDYLAEIEYIGGSGDYAVYRKQAGSEDPSGDYNEYSVENMISLKDIKIMLKGDGELYNLAVWTYEDYSYSMYLSAGISEDKFRDILNGVVN